MKVYMLSEFIQKCKDDGIVRQYIQAITPQQNGMSERMNRSFLDKVSCMMLDYEATNFLQIEAISAATYLLNRCSMCTNGCDA